MCKAYSVLYSTPTLCTFGSHSRHFIPWLNSEKFYVEQDEALNYYGPPSKLMVSKRVLANHINKTQETINLNEDFIYLFLRSLAMTEIPPNNVFS